MHVSAQSLPEDKTSSVATWAGNTYTSATDGVSLKENYVANTTTTGNIFSQEVTGLAQGYYKLTLYANAIYTPERGFASDASDFDSDRVFIFATGNGATSKTAVPVKYGIITTGSEAYTVNAYVGADGKLTIGMNKEKNGTNWHTIATKSLLFYGDDLTTIKSELNSEINTATGLSVDASEQTYLNSAIDAAETVYASSTVTFDEIDAAITTLKIAEKYAKGGFSSATLSTPVLTDFVVNGDFASFTNDWPNGGWYTTAGVGNHGQMTEADKFAWENYSWGNEKLSGKMYYRMTEIPNGAYSVSIDGFSRTAASTYIYANKERVYLTSSETYETVVIPVIVKNNMLEIGEYSGKIDWMKIMNVKVSYTGDPLASYKNTIKNLIETGEGLDVTGIPASVASAMTSVIDTYKPVYTSYTEEDECTAAISALQPAIEKAQAYIKAKSTIDKINTLLSNTNLYTSSAYTTFYTYVSKFTNAEYTVEEANSLEGVVFGTGWRTTAAIDDFLISAWDVNARDWSTYHVNTWSTTGDSGNPNFVTPCIEYWIGDAETLGDKVMTATLPDFVPGAEYKVTATICLGVNTGVDASTSPTGVTLQLNEGDAVSVCTGSRIAETRFYEGTFEANGMIGLDGKLNVKINVAGTNASWITFRNVSYEMTADAAAPTSEEIAALNSAISAAEKYSLGFETGEYAPYNNVEGLTALATAQDVIANHTDSKLSVTSATTALTSATWNANATEVECVYNGNFALGQGSAAANIQQYGWTRTNAWGQFRNDLSGSTTGYYNQPGSLQYGNAGVYTMPLKANTVYNLTFQYASWEDGSNNGMTVSVLNAEDGMAAMAFDAYATKYTNGLTTQSLVFVTGATGNYVLTLANGGNTVITGVSITKAASQTLEFADNDALPSYAPGTYPSVKVARSIKAGKNTLVLPFSMTEELVKATFGNNAKVYTVSKYDNDNITFASQTTINANEPCILVSEEAVSELNLTNVAVAAATANPTKEGTSVKMIGSYAASTEIAADANNYVVSGNELWLVEGSAVTMKGTRAYIQIEVSGTAPSRLTWSFDEVDATAIDEIVNGQSVNGQSIYNLNGQQLNSLQRGINIVGGKKVFVK
ncbi:MAG: hypothetical protein IJ528_04940 [Bacteroidaceae bacterium]|nr:hypothetical protein [Bacteroidaceae bacterium]